MITNKNEGKATTGYISCDCKCKFNITSNDSKPKWNNKTCQCEYTQRATIDPQDVLMMPPPMSPGCLLKILFVPR